MESYGEILKNKRLEKGLEFEQISSETVIAVNYLKALEEEDDSVFPGEPYLVGFLKIYSDYLGLETEKLLQLYHSKVLQESPVPEGLIVHEKPKSCSCYCWSCMFAGFNRNHYYYFCC